MQPMNEVVDYLAPLPFLPGLSIFAIVIGVALMLARRLRPLIARRGGPFVSRTNQEQSSRELYLHSPPSENPATEAGREYARDFFTFLLLGLFAGWLELGLVLVSRTVNPHISIDAPRTEPSFPLDGPGG